MTSESVLRQRKAEYSVRPTERIRGVGEGGVGLTRAEDLSMAVLVFYIALAFRHSAGHGLVFELFDQG